MRVIICTLVVCFFLDPEPDTKPVDRHGLQPAFPFLQFDMPVELTSPDEDTKNIFVVEQRGRLIVFENNREAKSKSIFLDITKKVDSGGEKGLLGLAFDPSYSVNGFFYINYTRSGPLETVISRFRVDSSNPNKADPQSEEVILTYRQPFSNHNGGKVAFGPDGYLYISAGDGGSGGDPRNNGQDRKSLLGKILRIDVNNRDREKKYGIPPDNPFKNNKHGYRDEIYAYGLRNVWRFSFDDKSGMLWAGDVGQNAVEEIDIIEKNGNYGWRIMEAGDCFRTSKCDTSNLKLPIWSYRQGSETGRSVTGGYVCRDKHIPGLTGKYIYGDFVSGNIWALTYSGKRAANNELIATLSDGLSSFGEDGNKNLYVLAYGSGKIYKLVTLSAKKLR